MSGTHQVPEGQAQVFQRYDAHVRENVAQGGFGMATSTEEIDALRRILQEDREIGVVRSGGARSRKRPCSTGNGEERSSKRTRVVDRRERSEEEQRDDVARVLSVLDEEFAEKKRLSDGEAW